MRPPHRVEALKPVSPLLQNLLPELTTAAQTVYDNWEQDQEGLDPELGTGGICDRISNALSSILAFAGLEAEEAGQDGDDHSFLLVKIKDESFFLDLPSYLYETGGGYRWKKRPNITFCPQDFVIWTGP
jgi:hypothetical protein